MRRVITLDNLEVSGERLLEDRVSEEAAFGDVAHEEFDDYRELVYCLIETGRGGGRGSTPYSLLQVRMCRTVIQLNRLDSAEIIMVTCMLGIGGGDGENWRLGCDTCIPGGVVGALGHLVLLLYPSPM